MQKPVVVVGAGLAGLACTRKLVRAGIPVFLVEASDRVGGRLKTDNVDGFLLDHGFQVHLTAYPNAARELDIEALELGSFTNGALVWDGTKTHVVDESKPLAMLKGRFLPIFDLLKLRTLAGEMRRKSVQEIATMAEEPAMQLFQEHKIGEELLNKFLRPFFGGIFLDRSLNVSSRQLAFVWKMLGDGTAALPKHGIASLADQIAEEIPRYLVRLNSRVEKVLAEGGKVSGVLLDTGETLEASTVVVATEGDVAAQITGLQTVEGSKKCVTLYFEVPKPVISGKYLLLNANGDALVNEVAPLTNVQPAYAPKGKHLVSVTILGDRPESDEQLVEMAKVELNAMLPDGNLPMWRFIRSYRVRYAQYAQPSGVFRKLPGNVTDVDGLYFAGEFTTNSSIDGAIQSGATCGNLLVRQWQSHSEPVAA